jgi:25S rRNA (uracil2634-N3)-methyltransferase
MAKNKSRKLAPSNSKKTKQPHKSSKPTGISKPKSSSKPSKSQQHTEPIIPLSSSHRILLLGEGDLSFARSLVSHHACTDVVATVYEKEAELKEKYPHAAENIRVIEEGSGSVRYGIDATKKGGIWKEFTGKIDRVIFNFPHVGGKSTDVNRQVRYNQELLVAFFTNALPVLALPVPAKQVVGEEGWEEIPAEEGGKIVVTLFEGDPYTLWNVRDLARHAGLGVERSFRFQAEAYEGYGHVRTLGVLKRKDGKEGGGWKGEERAARSFVFVRKEDAVQVVGKKKKKGNGAESSSDEDEDEIGKGSEDKHKKEEKEWMPGHDGESAVHPSRRGNVPDS